jgi:SWI/SNF related-matrix-associated actin-dependent regulator of chromatin subfamily C
LSVDWLFDTNDFNEFMSEEDYEVDESGDTQSSELIMTYDEFAACEEKPKKKQSKKRGRSPSPTPQTQKGGRKAKG